MGLGVALGAAQNLTITSALSLDLCLALARTLVIANEVKQSILVFPRARLHGLLHFIRNDENR